MTAAARLYTGEDAWDAVLYLVQRGRPVFDAAGVDVSLTVERAIVSDHRLKVLKADVSALSVVANKASAAMNFLLGLTTAEVDEVLEEAA